MKDHIGNWIERHARIPGVLACGCWFPDKSSVERLFSDRFSPESIAQAAVYFTDLYKVLLFHRLPTQRLRWTFRDCLITCARRSDGHVLSVLSARAASEHNAVLIDNLSTAFLEL